MPESPQTTDAASRAVRIVTGSRLHFGLLDTATPFGGIGVMIDLPVTEVRVRSSDAFDGSGPDASRIEAIAKRVAAACGESTLPQCRVQVSRRPPSHSGLGSGTQLSLALAEAIIGFLNCQQESAKIATELADRGKRSAVGSHGYFHGGLIYEDAALALSLNPIQQRVELPREWHVAVLRPANCNAIVSGEVEAAQFEKLPTVSACQRDQLRSLISNEILPAAREGKFQEFADAVHRYNRASGELFAEVQGGPYHGPEVTKLVNWLVSQGVAGVGQSSWGPGVFAWFESEVRWQAFRTKIPSDVTCITATSVRNQGRDLFVG